MIDFNLRKSTYLFLFLFLNLQLISCAQNGQLKSVKVKSKKGQSLKSKGQSSKFKGQSLKLEIKTGAERSNLYLNLLKGKNVAVVANQTSVLSVKVSDSKKEIHHLVDYLYNNKEINVKKVFAPEHGFRGKADAAEFVKDGLDAKTGLPIVSLYGKNKKPSAKQLSGIDVVVFDIQDVGVRFYTYISTLHYVMEACAEVGINVIILDRPNPNAHYVDGPVLELKHKSFVGMHKVPVVYGMTIGEYGQMINGEKWLKNGVKCNLKVIPLENYTHNSEYSLRIRPSPNLPNDTSINLYPSLGFFEGTTINAGRGTEFQFQRYGASFFAKSNFNYTPKPNFGAKYPKHKGKLCFGVDLNKTEKLSSINLEWLIDAYNKTPKTEKFFGKTFTIHAGNTKLQQQIEQGISEKEIRKTWTKDLENFKKIRERYLIYK